MSKFDKLTEAYLKVTNKSKVLVNENVLGWLSYSIMKHIPMSDETFNNVIEQISKEKPETVPFIQELLKSGKRPKTVGELMEMAAQAIKNKH